jgi:hypothetical protein
MSVMKPGSKPEETCWDCGAANWPEARECWLCHRRDWKSGARAVSFSSASTRADDERPTPVDGAERAAWEITVAFGAFLFALLAISLLTALYQTCSGLAHLH